MISAMFELVPQSRLKKFLQKSIGIDTIGHPAVQRSRTNSAAAILSGLVRYLECAPGAIFHFSAYFFSKLSNMSVESDSARSTFHICRH